MEDVVGETIIISGSIVCFKTPPKTRKRRALRILIHTLFTRRGRLIK